MNDKTKDSCTLLGASRRSFIKKSAVIAVAAATGPWIINSRVLAASREVKVLAWVDYVNQDMIDGFEKETNIKVNLTTFGSNDEAEQKTKASGGKGWDVIFPSVTNRSNYEDPNAPGGIWLAPIDETRANLKAIIPSFLRDSIQLGAVYRGKRYLIPYDWGTEGITFNSKVVNLKDAEVSYGDLWRPEVKGKVAFRQKSVIMGTGLYLDSIGVVKSNRMLDVYKSEEAARRAWSGITEWIIERKDWFGAFWNNATEATSAFKDAGAVIGQTWDTTGLLLAQEDSAYKFRAPKEGIITWLDSVGVLAGAENLDEAYEFINYILTPKVGATFSNKTGYNSAVAGSSDYTSDTFKRQFAEVYTPDVLNNMWWWQADTPWFAPMRSEFVEKISNA